MLDSPALRNVNCLFNITESVIICRSHQTVIPSSSTTIEVLGFKITYVETILISINIDRDFFIKLLSALPPILTARELIIQRHTQGIDSLVNRIPSHEGFQCRRCNACGPRKHIQDHIARIHKGSFATLATPVLLQQYNLNGVYSP
jgi:hypothetical protein